jgi:signal transduction histidine kinase
VPTSPVSSASRLPGVGPALLLVAAIGFGLLSEDAAFGLNEPRRWVPDLVVGATLAGVGIFALRISPGTGVLLLASGIAWWVGNFIPALAYLHRGLTFHAVTTYPGWRTEWKGSTAVLAVAYLGACLPAIASTELGTAAFGLAVAGVAAVRLSGVVGQTRKRRLFAVYASIALLIGSTGTVVLRIVVGGLQTAGPALLVYQASLVAAAVLLGIGLRIPSTDSIADLVVELGEARSSTLRDELARLLGDPLLGIGFGHGDSGFVDAQGAPFEIPATGSGRVATTIERETGERVVIVHDEALSADGVLLNAVATVARLLTANAQLNAAARDRLADLAASRRRLLDAEEEERRRLSRRLRDHAEERLTAVDRGLSAIVDDQATEPTVATSVKSTLEQLRLASQDLDSIVQGLDPWDKDSDLRTALTTLAVRSPIPIDVEVSAEPMERAVASTIYYVCSEAVANALKHADAHHITIAVRRGSAGLTVLVTDDGAGGADPAAGTGLRGLMDRVAALGGDLKVESRCGVGTTLVGLLPSGTGP